jgi:hypothetical protein
LYLGGAGNYSRELVGRTACPRTSDYDGLRYCGDRVQAVATEIDKCGGYAGRDGAYKYMVTPACLQQQLRYKYLRAAEPFYDLLTYAVDVVLAAPTRSATTAHSSAGRWTDSPCTDPSEPKV